MAFNPMDFFQAGGQLGQANASPFSYGASNVMNMFNQANKLGMMMNMQKGLQENEQQVLNKYEPQRKKQELQTEYGLQQNMFGNILKNLKGGGDASSSPDASKPAQSGGMDSKKTNTSPSWKSVKLGPVEIGNPNYDASVTQAKIPAESQMEGAKKAASTFQDLENLKDQSLNIIQNGISTFKQMNEGNPLTKVTGGAGRLAGIGNVYGAMTGTNPAATSWESHKIEMATELAKIANPSGRPGPDLIGMYQKLLPGDFTNYQEAASKFSNALHNALARYHGAKQAMQVQQGQKPEIYNRALYDPQVQSILGSPASKQLNLNSNPLQQAASKGSQYSIGQVIPINGKSYRVIGLSDPSDPDLEPA